MKEGDKINTELKIININITVEEFMESEQFEKEINEPARDYYSQVYELATRKLTEPQKRLYDEWWNGKSIPSDECYWKKTEVPQGYEYCTPEDIYEAHNMILYTVSMGCG